MSRESEKNHKIRNENLKNQLERLKLEMLEQFREELRTKKELNTSELNKIHNNCLEHNGKMEAMKEDIQEINKKLEKIMNKIDQYNDITVEFKLVRMIVFGMVGMILLTVLGSVIALVIMSK